jgi:hypothetical protein
MISFLIIGTIVGILLGLRFKFFVLIPATLVAACAIIAISHGIKTIAATTLATSALLQIGYVLGCVIRVHADAYREERTHRGTGSQNRSRGGLEFSADRHQEAVPWSRKSAPSGSVLV